jgi:hypothetical protein
MWVCEQCRMLVTLEVAQPNIDDDGICFVCPVCHHRNALRAVPRANADDPLELRQIGQDKTGIGRRAR